MNAVQLSWGIFTTNFYFVCFVSVPGNMSGLGILLITSSKVLYICTSKRLLDSLLFLQLHAHCSLCQEHFNNLLSGQPDPFFFSSLVNPEYLYQSNLPKTLLNCLTHYSQIDIFLQKYHIHKAILHI